MAQFLADMLATRANALDFSALLGVLPNPDPILRAQGKSIEVYRDLRVDAHVGSCCRRRKSAVKALEWGIDRGQARAGVSKAIESMLADVDLDRLIGDCTEAVLYGYQPIEIGWGKVGDLIVPRLLEAKPPEWFVFDADNLLRLKTRRSPFVGEALPERKFLLPRQDATYQNPYGFPDLSMVFWPTLFKKGGVKFWLKFTEKYGMPFPVGKQPRGASEAERSTLLDSLEAMVQDAVAVIPDDSSVELLSVSNTAHADLYEKLVMFCRSEVSIALTGTNQTTEASSNKASAMAGLEVAHDLRDGDAEVVAAAINQLIQWICEINWGAVDRPRWSFWDQEAKDTLQSDRDKSNYDAGARFTNAYWQRVYGYQDGDLAAPSAPAAIPGEAALPGQTAVPSQSAPAPAFADPAPEMALSDQLAEAAAAPWQKVLGQVQALVEAAPDLPTLQKTLLAAFGDLDTARLVEIMQAGFALAELRGMVDARDG
ncbi:MAG TPA: DUF935 family protein [Accumulibacter sp.]|uniref:DUF935 domain-containing protein n=1 Tax=Accumulibacter sp. TaxID=2053492 RepID=UPI0025EB025E|nr:DUF935 family protein [Accumulibacter sp.]MCM8599954.1 DUF935 domain-containing protein [Accumulibacter sp.]MCM8664138.1 DUF935 domain-containing protein [Accumulibacter sp.]HNC51206.1 DUF935 family protein [Accumulibacter sp.]